MFHMSKFLYDKHNGKCEVNDGYNHCRNKSVFIVKRKHGSKIYVCKKHSKFARQKTKVTEGSS